MGCICNIAISEKNRAILVKFCKKSVAFLFAPKSKQFLEIRSKVHFPSEAKSYVLPLEASCTGQS
jgi:hypothetical protein